MPSGGGSSGGSSPFTSATVTLTDAQIKALPTTAVQLVAPPGAGRVLVPTFLFMHLTWVADYTNIGSLAGLACDWDTTGASPLAPLLERVAGSVSNLLADGASHVALCPPEALIDGTANIMSGLGQIADDPGPINAALVLDCTNAGTLSGNFTGGDPGNSLKITVYYATFAI